MLIVISGSAMGMYSQQQIFDLYDKIKPDFPQFEKFGMTREKFWEEYQNLSQSLFAGMSGTVGDTDADSLYMTVQGDTIYVNNKIVTNNLGKKVNVTVSGQNNTTVVDSQNVTINTTSQDEKKDNITLGPINLKFTEFLPVFIGLVLTVGLWLARQFGYPLV